MKFWKRLRWVASLAFATVLLIALLAAFYRHSGDELEPEEAESEQRVFTPVPVPAKGQPTRNSTGL